MITTELIMSFPEDGKVYLAERLNQFSGFFVCNSQLIYAVESSETSGSGGYTTSSLELCMSVYLKVVDKDECGFDSGVFDLIKLDRQASTREVLSFYDICIAHNSSNSTQNLSDFFNTLLTLFQPEILQSKLNGLGLFGELAILSRFVEIEKSTDPAQYWQKTGSHSKYDFCLPSGNIEVKTTTLEQSIVLIKHNQLFNESNNYLVYVTVENDPSGESLQELAMRLKIDSYCFTSIDTLISLERELLRVNEKDMQTRYSVVDCIMYEAATINPFNDIPTRVSSLTYKYDVVDLPSCDLTDTYCALVNTNNRLLPDCNS